jgi:hypothetical protein
MKPRRSSPLAGPERGTASVEAVAILPFLLLAILAAAQIGLAGQSLWSAALAARAGARAALVGRAGEAAARRALPAALRGGSSVRSRGTVSVRLGVPQLLPLPRQLSARAETTLEGGGG